MLCKLLMPGRPTLDNSRARAYCACSRCGWGLFGHVSFVYLFCFLSPSLGDGPILTEIMLQRDAKPKISKQPTQVGTQRSIAWHFKAPRLEPTFKSCFFPHHIRDWDSLKDSFFLLLSQHRISFYVYISSASDMLP